MAVDEVLFRSAQNPVVRIYYWEEPAVTFGYFERLADVETRWPGWLLVRRWTGGGQVEHGRDLTYSVMMPAGPGGAMPLARTTYQFLHAIVAEALRACGVPAVLATEEVIAAGGPCFVKPVAADVLAHGKKIAGAAQRRNRTGMLHQGSIQGVAIPNSLPTALLAGFEPARTIGLDPSVLREAEQLAGSKYATAAWRTMR